MPNPLAHNTLFYGDNLFILRDYLPHESVDLIYLDPPFNSNRSYNVLFKEEQGDDSEAQITAFDDTWHWGAAAEETYYALVTDAAPRVGQMVAAMREFVGTNQMMAYLVMMAARLVELHRVLKPTGSLYLHCDPTASHYLKIILDTIFGAENFRNEVIWQRTATKGDARRKFGAVHDVLFSYQKTDNATFYPIFMEADESYLSRFKMDDNDGKGSYRLAPLDSPNPRPNLTYPYKGYSPPTKGWRVSLPVMEQLDKEGRLYFPKDPKGRIARKHYLLEQEGRKISDVWTDIPPLQASAAERLGYPTQKPVALLERILQASSNEGDVVLDPFCGCGTTIAAAQKLGRKWLGIDITHLSISLQKYRLKDSFALEAGRDYQVIGEPEDVGSARHLFQQDAYQFQWWALSLIGAKPLGGNSASGGTSASLTPGPSPQGGRGGRAEGKKGADKGVDGVITFIEDKGKPARIMVQVKGGHVKSGDIRDLRGVLDREAAALGFFVTLEAPTKDMLTEAVSAGYYDSPLWGQRYPRLQILTIENLLNGQRPQMPPVGANVTFQRAEKVKKEDGKQGKLL